MFLAVRFHTRYDYIRQADGSVGLPFAEQSFDVHAANFHLDSGCRGFTVSIFNLEEIQEKFCAVPDCRFPSPELSVTALATPVGHRQFATQERRENVLAGEVQFRSTEHAGHLSAPCRDNSAMREGCRHRRWSSRLAGGRARCQAGKSKAAFLPENFAIGRPQSDETGKGRRSGARGAIIHNLCK